MNILNKLSSDIKNIDQLYYIDDRNWFQTLYDSWNKLPVTPYINIRKIPNLRYDSTDGNEKRAKNGIEIGINIKF